MVNVWVFETLTRRFVAATGLAFMPRDRHRVYFAGRVQGVGFRYTCQSLARGFEVAGYVRNLTDGRVELVAEGENYEIEAFLEAIQLQMHPYIKGMETEVQSAGEPQLFGFSIRD